MKSFYKIASLALITLAFAACDNDDKKTPESVIPGAPSASQGVYVLTQGQFYNGVEGGLDVITFDTRKVDKNVFKAANGRSLGDTPQCGLAYGSKIYIGTSESNTIEILDRFTWKSIKQISVANVTSQGQPYSMVARKGKIFISMFGGALARLDTMTLMVDKVIPVGNNPDQIALYNDRIYMPISDGMNYPNYGKTAVIVNPETMEIEKNFETALNPRKFFTCKDKLYLLCMGNYYDIESCLYEVESNLKLKSICPATIADAYGDKIAVINQPFSEGEPVVEYKLYNPSDGSVSGWEIERPDYANNLFYDEEADRMLISSYVMSGKYPSYVLPGYVNSYKSGESRVEYKYELGAAGPATFFTLIRR